MYKAAQKGHLEIMRLLIEHGADPNKAKANGATPMHMAVQQGHLDIVKLLIEHDADPNKAQPNGATPVFMAAQAGHVSAITVIVDAGGRTGTVLTTNGATDLWTACWQGHVDVVQYLLTRPNVEIDRARSDQRDAEDRDAPFAGTTPLEVTIVAGHDGIADLLRQHGATASAFPDDALRSFYIREEEGHTTQHNTG